LPGRGAVLLRPSGYHLQSGGQDRLPFLTGEPEMCRMRTRRTLELHRGRESSPGAAYFVTCCTADRSPGLTSPLVARMLVDAVRQSDARGDTRTLAFTVMPDHCHWLFELGYRLSLGRIVARFKVETSEACRRVPVAWQRDFYEHRLQADETPEDYALYTFLNPYRAGLIHADRCWPWWWPGRCGALLFPSLLSGQGTPPRQWIVRPIPSSVRHGE
jgi:putative transposase